MRSSDLLNGIVSDMGRTPFIAAFEGPCCAGKTTQSQGVIHGFGKQRIAYVADYSDFVGGGRNLPPPIPESLEDERQHLGKFLELEAARTAHCGSAPRILIDRSIHTLLAHCYALERITGREYSAVAKPLIEQSSIPFWPQQIFYLDIEQDEVQRRNQGKFPMDSIFINPDFNRGILEYFEGLRHRKPGLVHRLDASRPRDTLRKCISGLLDQAGWRGFDDETDG
jgi:thymidylate kinase